MTTPVVLISGALTGIGRATALAFAHEGACIVNFRKTETYYNKRHGQERIEQILNLISEDFLAGEALKAKV